MEKIPLKIMAVSPQYNYTNAYNLILGEVDGDRKLVVTMGIVEAQAIAIQIDGMSTARPLVYDFISNFAKAFDIDVEEVVIANVEKDNFYSEVVCRRYGVSSDDEIVRINARTPDAVALALKFGCPIYTYEVVLEMAGIRIGDSNAPKAHKETRYGNFSDEELQQMLERAIRREDYEKAAKIQCELARRSQSK